LTGGIVPPATVMGLGKLKVAAARRYVAAGLITVAVVMSRLRLDAWLGHYHNRHLFFLPTVMLIAWLCGFGPGLLSGALFGAALRFFWPEQTGTFIHVNSDVILFMLVSAAVCVIIRSMERARQSADASRRSLEQVVAIVAHDLANPLHAVTLAGEHIRKQAGDAQAVERGLRTISRATTRMERLLRDLSDTTRIAHGELVLTLRAEPVPPILQDVAQVFGPQSAAAGVTLDTTLPRTSSVIECDRDRLMQILGNLLGNALKFTREGGRIDLRATDEDDAVRFEVADTGAGIDPKHLPYIFDRFQSYDARGTGLGLFIARSLVRAHGGELSVRSSLGLGSTFSFAIPRLPRASSADTTRRSAQQLT
jgi:signal transduction histidine kinase